MTPGLGGGASAENWDEILRSLTQGQPVLTGGCRDQGAWAEGFGDRRGGAAWLVLDIVWGLIVVAPLGWPAGQAVYAGW